MTKDLYHRPIVGVVGGGQLARMMLAPAAALDIDLRVLAESADDPAVQIGAKATIGNANDEQTLRAFAENCDVLTFEHEIINPALLRALSEDPALTMQPSNSSKLLAQDKYHQRKTLSQSHPSFIPHWQLVQGIDDVTAFAGIHGWPVVAKAARGGYDGRGVWFLQDTQQAAELLEESTLRNVTLIVERSVAIEQELAVLVARNQSGDVRCYPVVETVQKDGICHEVLAPALTDMTVRTQATKLATSLAVQIQSTGILAVELFLENSRLFINELALRPHNTGHFTIEGCVTSQFENHLRGILNFPLGSTKLTTESAVMKNILGPADGSDPRERLQIALRDSAAHIHLYGKAPRAGRKLGHVTVIGEDAEQLRQQADHASKQMTNTDD